MAGYSDGTTDNIKSLDWNEAQSLPGELVLNKKGCSPVLVGTTSLPEVFVFLKEYFGDEAEVIELRGRLLVLTTYKDIEPLAEALNIAFQENFLNSTQVLYFRNGKNLTLEEKIEELYRNHELLSRMKKRTRIAASEDLTLLGLADGLSPEIRHSYMKDLAPSYARLSPELRLTLSTFFDENLSMSKTAKKLYIHRNTLTYRIGKIQQITGLDIRKINEAIKLILASCFIPDGDSSIS